MVALKVLRPTLSTTLAGDRFLREIQVAARLTHPHILPLYDSGESEGFLLPDAVHRGRVVASAAHCETRLPVGEAVKIGREVADALTTLTAVGSSIGTSSPRTSSWAPATPSWRTRYRTGAQRVGRPRRDRRRNHHGNPGLHEPGASRWRGGADGRSDIYSLGCVVFELLASRPPFVGRTAVGLLVRRLSEPAPLLRTIDAAVPAPAGGGRGEDTGAPSGGPLRHGGELSGAGAGRPSGAC